MVTFALAGTGTLICLAFVLNAPPPPPKPAAAASNHYVLNHVLVHIGGRLSHTHTFLVDQQTGELWLMTCRGDKTVEFRRIQKRKLDGTPEEAVVSAKPAEK